jgi:transposase
MSDILTLEAKETKYLSKEEISDLLGISVNTIQKWLNSYKAIEEDFKTVGTGKKLFSTNYIARLLENVNRKELIDLLNQTSTNTSTEAQPKVDITEDPVFKMALQGKDELIGILKDQLNIKDAQIEELTGSLKQQQYLHLEATKEIKALQTKKKRFWFFG